jgi:hypothetical protein
MRWSHPYRALRLLLWELCSLVHRIRWILQIYAVERLGGKDSIRRWMNSSGVPVAYKSDYIPYMQQMEALHPFLSIFDRLLLTQAWKAGLESGIRIGMSQSQDKVHS